jgi:phosphoglycolate phosphatase
MYPGARKMLVGMKKTGKKAFLLTNKPATATNRILHQLKIESFFVEVVCPDSVSPPLGHKKEGALLLRQKHRLLSGETLLVGDSQDDMVAAGAAGFQFGIVLYGYGGLSRNPDRSYFLVLQSPRDFGKIARTMYKKIYD